MFTTYSNTNKVHQNGPTITYTSQPKYGSDKTQPAFYTITRHYQDNYTYVGMTEDAAVQGANDLRKKFTRKYKTWTATEKDGVVDISPDYVRECKSVFQPTHNDGHIWSIQCQINDEDTIVSLTDPEDDDAYEKLFIEENFRNEDSGLVIIRAQTRERDLRCYIDFEQKIEGFMSGRIYPQYKDFNSGVWTDFDNYTSHIDYVEAVFPEGYPRDGVGIDVRLEYRMPNVEVVRSNEWNTDLLMDFDLQISPNATFTFNDKPDANLKYSDSVVINTTISGDASDVDVSHKYRLQPDERIHDLPWKSTQGTMTKLGIGEFMFMGGYEGYGEIDYTKGLTLEYSLGNMNAQLYPHSTYYASQTYYPRSIYVKNVEVDKYGLVAKVTVTHNGVLPSEFTNIKIKLTQYPINLTWEHILEITDIDVQDDSVIYTAKLPDPFLPYEETRFTLRNGIAQTMFSVYLDDEDGNRLTSICRRVDYRPKRIPEMNIELFAGAAHHVVSLADMHTRDGEDFKIQWGDGEISNLHNGDQVQHTYENPGIYTINIIGDVTSICETAYPFITLDGVTKVDMPNVEWIGAHAFNGGESGNTSLGRIRANNLTTTSYNSFANLKMLTDVELNNVQTIDATLFENSGQQQYNLKVYLRGMLEDEIRGRVEYPFGLHTALIYWMSGMITVD